MHLVTAQLVRLFTRNMYHFIEKRISLFEQKIVSKNVKEELKFWRNYINFYNGYTFKPRSLTSCLLFTDASDEGYDRFILKHLNQKFAQQNLINMKKGLVQYLGNYLQ